MSLIDPLADRRQRVLEAYYDRCDPVAAERGYTPALTDAIETATRVRVDHEVLMAFIQAPDDREDIAGPLRAAFRAAGFEVEE